MRRISVVVLGIVALLAMGALAIHAQQPAGRAPRPGDREALRTKLVELRTEVEVLRLRRDAVRDVLLQNLGQVEVGKLNEAIGIDEWGFIGGKEPGQQANDARVQQPPEPVPQLEEVQEARKDAKRRGDALQQGLDRKVKDFSRLLTELNRKTLELDDLERQYRGGR